MPTGLASPTALCCPVVGLLLQRLNDVDNALSWMDQALALSHQALEFALGRAQLTLTAGAPPPTRTPALPPASYQPIVRLALV
jgi:hypothetical protein